MPTPAALYAWLLAEAPSLALLLVYVLGLALFALAVASGMKVYRLVRDRQAAEADKARAARLLEQQIRQEQYVAGYNGGRPGPGTKKRLRG